MKKLIICILILIPFIARSQNGSVKGNVFWKYNDYVGNRPDAGCKILLQQIGSENYYNTAADVSGNFQFDKLTPGKYLVITISKAVTKRPLDNLRMLLIYRATLESENILDFSRLTDTLIAFKRIDSISRIESDMIFKCKYNGDNSLSKKELKKLQLSYTTHEKELEKSSIDIMTLLLTQSFSLLAKKNMHIITQYSGISLEDVNIEEGKTESIVVDYGITYM